MTTYVFDRVEHRAVKVVTCSKCGKRIRRQETFWATENPWNVNDDGTPRTRTQIRERLMEKARAWQDEPASHATCSVVEASRG